MRESPGSWSPMEISLKSRRSTVEVPSIEVLRNSHKNSMEVPWMFSMEIPWRARGSQSHRIFIELRFHGQLP